MYQPKTSYSPEHCALPRISSSLNEFSLAIPSDCVVCSSVHSVPGSNIPPTPPLWHGAKNHNQIVVSRARLSFPLSWRVLFPNIRARTCIIRIQTEYWNPYQRMTRASVRIGEPITCTYARNPSELESRKRGAEKRKETHPRLDQSLAIAQTGKLDFQGETSLVW